MNRRDFAKGGIFAALLAVLPQSIVGQKKGVRRPKANAVDANGVVDLAAQESRFTCGPLEFRPVHLAKGETLPGHCHWYDHPSILHNGTMLVELTGYRNADGSITSPIPEDVKKRLNIPDRFVMEGPAVRNIPKDVVHVMTALETFDASCAFPHRDIVGRVTLEAAGNEDSYR